MNRPTLVVSSWTLPAASALADVARAAGWAARAFDERSDRRPHGRVVFYGGTPLSAV
jgi:hypothetical protein